MIPYPLAGGHQLVNAKVFCRDHDAMIAEQKDLTSRRLAEILTQFLSRIPEKSKPNGVPTYGDPHKNSRVLLADYILETIHQK